jgi:hypothetical protein
MAKIVIIGNFARSLINFRGQLLKKMAEEGYDVIACTPDASVDIQKKPKNLDVK